MLEYRIDVPGSNRVTGHGYLWMKRVTGFDPRRHCAQCLVGDYEGDFGLRVPVNEWRKLAGYAEGDIVYVCGVSRPYVWSNNRHLAARVKQGAHAGLDLHEGGQRVLLRNAELIPFDGQAAANKFGHKPAAYTTCRNFQFGASLFCDAV